MVNRHSCLPACRGPPASQRGDFCLHGIGRGAPGWAGAPLSRETSPQCRCRSRPSPRGTSALAGHLTHPGLQVIPSCRTCLCHSRHRPQKLQGQSVQSVRNLNVPSSLAESTADDDASRPLLSCKASVDACADLWCLAPDITQTESEWELRQPSCVRHRGKRACFPKCVSANNGKPREQGASAAKRRQRLGFQPRMERWGDHRLWDVNLTLTPHTLAP